MDNNIEYKLKKYKTMKYEMEINFKEEFVYEILKSSNIPVEVIYHTFNDLTKIDEELEWILNCDEKIPMSLIESIRIYEL